jgi:hypothetical protein
MNILLICILLLATIATSLVVFSFASHSLEISEKSDKIDIGFFSSLSRNVNQTIGEIQGENVSTSSNTR